MSITRMFIVGLATVLTVFAAAPMATAAPDVAGSVAIVEPLGFPGICDQPCYTVSKSFEVYFGGNATNPLGVQPAGVNTYIYKLTHTGGTGTPLGFIPAITGFEIAMDTSRVLSAGAIAGPGVPPFPNPAVANVEALTVRYQFQDPANPATVPGILPPGTGPAGSDFSQQLFITSDLLPGTVTDNAVSVDGTLSLDAPGSCVGPFVEPQVDVCDIEVNKEACVVQPPDPLGDDCDSDVQAMTLTYTGLDCSASSHLQNPKKVKCTGDPALAEPVRIVVSDKKKKKVWGIATGVPVGGSVTATATNAGKNKLKANTLIRIFRESDNALLQTVRFHTSCSEPLGVGNQFGSLLLTSLTSGGTTTTLPDPADCVSEATINPPPHCKGVATTVRFRYTGGDCSTSNNDQGTADMCTQVNPPTANPVTIKVSDAGMTNVFVNQSGVNVGDVVDAAAANAALSQFISPTHYTVTDDVTTNVIQTGKLVTDCDDDDDSDSDDICNNADTDWGDDSDCEAEADQGKPLNLGDTFGALQVFSVDSTLGVSSSLGVDVEYRYRVSNIGTTTVDSVSLLDDQIGVVPGSPVGPLPPPPGPGDIINLSTIVPDIDVTTTNTVTATGFIGANQCDVAVASATVTINQPPDPGDICT
ncbi:MAG: hypothetical protein ACE5EX_10870, partial [Phycisphaerae bacterium]